MHNLQATHFQSIGGVRERGVVDSLSNGESERECVYVCVREK